jgi:hypothetical protein
VLDVKPFKVLGGFARNVLGSCSACNVLGGPACNVLGVKSTSTCWMSKAL